MKSFALEMEAFLVRTMLEEGMLDLKETEDSLAFLDKPDPPRSPLLPISRRKAKKLSRNIASLYNKHTSLAFLDNPNHPGPILPKPRKSGNTASRLTATLNKFKH